MGNREEEQWEVFSTAVSQISDCSKKIFTKQLMTDIEEEVSVGRDAINLRKGGCGARK